MKAKVIGFFYLSVFIVVFVSIIYTITFTLAFQVTLNNSYTHTYTDTTRELSFFASAMLFNTMGFNFYCCRITSFYVYLITSRKCVRESMSVCMYMNEHVVTVGYLNFVCLFFIGQF